MSASASCNSAVPSTPDAIAFGRKRSYGAIIEHLRGFAKPRLAAALKGINEIADDGYDWSLNAAAA